MQRNVFPGISLAANCGKSNMPKTKYYIRNGQIVTDASDAERVASRLFRFPGTGQRLDGQPAEPHEEIVPSRGPTPTTYLKLVRELDRELNPFTGPGLPLDVPFQQRFQRYWCEAWARCQANQTEQHTADSTDEDTSSLPALTPEQIGRMGQVLPMPPAPYGYARLEFESGFLDKIRSGRPDKICTAALQLISDCESCQFYPQKLKERTQALQVILVNVHTYFKPGDADKNLIFITEFGLRVDYIKRLASFWRRQLKRYAWTISATEEMSVFCIEIPKRHDCLATLSSKIIPELQNLEYCLGKCKIDAFWALLPDLIKLRALDLLLPKVLHRQGGRRLFIHSACNFKMSQNDIRIFKGRLAAEGDGRPPKGWHDKTFKPLHQHVAGYAENLIYSWQGGHLYVHGLVTWHLDQDMSGQQVKQSDAIEKRGKKKEEFVECFLWSDSQAMFLPELLALDVLKLCEMCGVIPAVKPGKWDKVYLALASLLSGNF
jgi:hypothetical protein